MVWGIFLPIIWYFVWTHPILPFKYENLCKSVFTRFLHNSVKKPLYKGSVNLTRTSFLNSYNPFNIVPLTNGVCNFHIDLKISCQQES